MLLLDTEVLFEARPVKVKHLIGESSFIDYWVRVGFNLINPYNENLVEIKMQVSDTHVEFKYCNESTVLERANVLFRG